MKKVALWIFVIYWFLHLLFAAGAGAAIIRLWGNRTNPFLRRLALYMTAMPLGALYSIVLVFTARGIKLNWKFSITWFAGSMLMDAVRVPLIVWLLKGNGDPKPIDNEH